MQRGQETTSPVRKLRCQQIIGNTTGSGKWTHESVTRPLPTGWCDFDGSLGEVVTGGSGVHSVS